MYKHILVPVDGSEPSNGALRTAISLSKEMGARIRLLHVVDRAVYLAGYDPSGGVSADMFATLRDSGYRILRDAATAAISEGLEVPGGHPNCPTFGHPNCSTLAAVI